MLTTIKRLLTPPDFVGDEDKTRLAWLLNIILLLLLARAVLFRFISWFQETAQTPRPSLFWPLTLLLLAMLLLLRRGHVRLASIITLAGFWLSLTAIAVINGGIHSTGFRNYILPVLIAGLLFGRGAALVTAGLSVLAGLLMWLAELSGAMPAPLLPGSSLELLITHAISLVLAALLVTLATYGIQQSLKRARQELAERKQVENALRESQRRFSDTLTNLEMIAVMADTNGAITFCNDYLLRLTGWQRAEIIGRNWFEMFLPEQEQPRVKRILAELPPGGLVTPHFENEIKTRAGERRLVKWTNTTLRDLHECVIGVAALGDDITERTLHEREVQRLTRLYATLSQVNQAVVRAASVETFLDKACRAIVEHGGFLLAWVGRLEPHSQVVEPVVHCGSNGGYLHSRLIRADESPEGQGPTGTCIREQQPYICNDIVSDPRTESWRAGALAYGIKASTAFPIRVAGKIWGALTIHSSESGFFGDKEMRLLDEVADDIGFALDNFARERARQEAEEALRLSESRYRKIVEVAPEAIVVVDLATGKFVDFNPQALALFQLSPAEILAVGPVETSPLFQPDGRSSSAAAQAYLAQALAGETPVFEWVHRNASGVEIPCEIRLLQLPDEARRLVRGTITDITERKRAEALMLNIAKGVSANVGEGFFRSLVEHLAKSLAADYAFVGELKPDNSARVRTIAVWADGQMVENFEYDLLDTPCANIVGEQLCSYPYAVQQSFPCDHLLAELAVEGYAGTPLFDSTGRALGLLVVLFRQPLQNVALVESLLQIFAARAAAELERKQAEEVVRRTEALFHGIVEDQTEMIVRWKPDGTRTFVNQAYCRAFGQSFDELVGTSFLPLVAESYREVVLQKIQRITPATPIAFDVHESLLPDGTTCWQEWTDRGLFDEQGQLIELQSVGRDVTERRQVEEALRASEERFSKAFNFSPFRMGIMRIRDGVVLDVNNRWVQEMGFTRVVIGQSIFELQTSWLRYEGVERLWQLLKEGKPFRDLEFSMSTESGEKRVVLASAEVIELGGEPCFLLAANDITERKRAEEAVRESEARFRQLTENIREVFWLNKPDLTELLYISPAYETIWGRTRESLGQNPRSFLDAIHPEDRPRVVEVFGQRLERAFEMEYRVVRPDGSIRWIWDRGFPIKDETGQVYRITGIAEDVTERKAVEAALRLSEEQLRATTKQLRALMISLRSAREAEGARIAREIHDELGSLLTSLRWELESFDKALAQAEAPALLQALRAKVTSMLKLTDTTIGTVRRIASELRPSVLDDLGLAEAIEWQAQEFQARTGLHCQCDCMVEEHLLSREQATALFRIFQEALTNILRHAQATRVMITLEEQAGECVLAISDNGRGITAEQQSALQSLGLLGMRERAHLIGGEVKITGTAGKGTTVRVRVPLVN